MTGPLFLLIAATVAFGGVMLGMGYAPRDRYGFVSDGWIPAVVVSSILLLAGIILFAASLPGWQLK